MNRSRLWLMLALVVVSTGCGPVVPETVTVQFLRATTTGGGQGLEGVSVRAYPDPEAPDEVCYSDTSDLDGQWDSAVCSLDLTWEAASVGLHGADGQLLDAWVWDPSETFWEYLIDSGEAALVVGDRSALTFRLLEE